MGRKWEEKMTNIKFRNRVVGSGRNRLSALALVAGIVIAAPMGANAQDRGTSYPSGSQDTRLPDGSSIGSRNPQEVADEAFRDGLAAIMEKDYKTCEKKFETVVELAKKSPEANYYLGVCKSRLGKDKRAVKYFETAIDELPDFVEAREQLALAQIKLNKPKKAAEQLDALKAIKAACEKDGCDDVIEKRVTAAVDRVETAMS